MGKRKKIFCEKCKEVIMTIDHNPSRPGYVPTGTDYITISAKRFGWDGPCPYIEPPEGKGYEHNHYYHFKCFGLPIPDLFPKMIEVTDG